MRKVGVRLQRVNLFDGPIAVRLVDRTNNSHHDPGSVTDGALAERLASHKPDGARAAEDICSQLCARPAEASFEERWPTFTQAIEHWTGERSRSPVRVVKWICRNAACNFSQDVQIGARTGETVPLRCRQCGRTQRVTLDASDGAPSEVFPES